MNAQEIKTSLYQKGFTLGMLAEATDTTASSFSAVIHRKSHSQRIANIISKALDCAVEDVFPDIPEYSLSHIKPPRNSLKRAEKIAALQQRLAS
ncbi:helix-turn-helix domain-containing protein [Agarivorans gilvus]|uniref:Ner winged helix-turn-helix DNA-binding domain-containing protein n=1 Tax=Agarivorans gilvus TaxID=680279 RepID=A0ABQ1HXN6_9ALTE|nr:helix-turn-helix domain-containing protein [Agarivorans gilvus]GGA95924.1 hypothetical protein GCM10007414_05980 [Agarivorans gilvus]